MPQGRPWWDWPHERPAWEPTPQRPPAESPRSPGRLDGPVPIIVARSEGEDTSAIEGALERLRRSAGRGAPPSQPPQGPPQPPWPGDGGTDRCAWYVSFRYGSAFGIYICTSCVEHIASQLWQRGMEDDLAQRVAFAFLYGHELFHYRVDRGVELLEHSLEIANGATAQLWLQRWVASRHHIPGNGLDLLEEACANQQALTAAVKEAQAGISAKPKRKRSKVDIERDKEITHLVLESMMSGSGKGYRDFDMVSRPNTGLAQDELMSWYVLIDARGKGMPTGPVSGVNRVIPRPVKKGNLNTDPDVPTYLVEC